ncbi:hypothetical protein TrST_g11227 [Triparma strigata]|uniref:Purple acid phosphatase n=1 Tax=Triparma strigata TaxID=1606541 RepID=A0A9W7ENU2_9STRA|nr:hypothetical protein TrST_g11227 [Triparma strigata]
MKFLTLLATLGLPAQASTITQIHIALAGSDDNGISTGMAVSFQTESDSPSASVRYGLSADSLSSTATATSSTYWETYDHHAVLESLEPSTQYYYQIVDGDDVSEVLSFTSAPTEKDSVNFAVFGDLGMVNGDSTRKYLTKLSENKEIDLIYHMGDVGYADDSFLHLGCYTRFCYEDAWNEFMNAMQPIVTSLPWMTMPGNHEADCHSPNCMLSSTKRDKLSNFTAYNSRFRMPSEESGGVMNMWHSFNHGPVHFIALDLETGFPGAAEETRYVMKSGGFGDQISWLEEDLKKAAESRAVRPWIVAGGHHPMYNGGRVDSKMQAAIEPLLKKYNVDVFFTGHVHSYERDWPTFNTTDIVKSYDAPGIPVHVMIGGPGNDEMSDGMRRIMQEIESGEKVDPSREPTEKWLAGLEAGSKDMIALSDEDHYGIGRVEANMTHFSFEYVQTADEVVFDSFVLTKSPLDKMEVPSADPDQCGNFCDPQFGPGCGPGACANCREAGLDAQGAIAYACQNW